MPIRSGARGRPGVLGIPGRVIPLGSDGPSYARSFGKKRFRSQPFSTASVYVSGVTRDSTGSALGSVTVQLFRTLDDCFLGETVSDGAGNFTVRAPGTGPFYLVAYRAGAPDLAGTTVNTVLPT